MRPESLANLDSLAILFIGFSVFSALSLALTHFRGEQYRDQFVARGAGMALLLALAALQSAHFAFLQFDQAWTERAWYHAALFVVATLRPDLLPRLAMHEPGGSVVVTQEAHTLVNVPRVASYADAARKAMPAVVNIYTSKEVRARNPLAEDPLFRRYFPELERGAAQRQTSLGSGVIVSPEGYVITNHHCLPQRGADKVVKIGEYDGVMSEAIPEINSPKNMLKAFEVSDAATYVFVLQSEDNRPVQAGVIINRQLTTSNGVAGVSFIGGKLPAQQKLTFVGIDFMAMLHPGETAPDGKVKVAIYQYAP